MAEFAVGLNNNQVVVNNQFNSPINLYSKQSLNETLAKQTTVLNNGAIGIDFHQLAAPNLAKSAVLRMLEEEHETSRGGVKRVAWPPPPDPSIISAIDSHNLQGEHLNNNKVNGITLEANPPAPLYYSPPPQQQGGVPPPVEQPSSNRWQASPVDYSNSAPVTVFSIPSVNSQQPPPPPSTVILRPSAPISQPPPPVYKSQPAIQKQQHSYMPLKMRGDQKWPPADVKANQEAEQQAIIARGPAVRPRLVRKDYSSFFAQHSLTPTYAGYRAPPGTQHYDENGRPINGNL